MSEVRVHDKTFVPFIPAEKIAEQVEELARKIESDYRDEYPIFLCVLSGAFVFAADLLRSLQMPCEIYFTKYKSYEGTESTGQVHEILGIPAEVTGRHVVVIEDIVESGLTVTYLMKQLEAKQPLSVKTCTLLFKPGRFHQDWLPDYTAFDIPDAFVIGYGLDYDGAGRHLKGIYQLKA